MNITKITLLFSRYFAENRRKGLQMLSVVFFCSAFFFFLDSQAVGAFSGLAVFIFYFAAMYLASTIFSIDMSRKENAMNYLLVPTNSIEKVVANLIIVHIFINIALLIALFSGIYLGTFFGSLYYQHPINFDIVSRFSTAIFTLENILEFLGFQALFIFGSVYFRKGAFVKTLLTLGLFALLLVLIGLSIFAIFYKETGYYYPSVGIDDWLRGLMSNYEWLSNLQNVIWIFFCWILTFLRLRETEA
jgi:hypothetical protein